MNNEYNKRMQTKKKSIVIDIMKSPFDKKKKENKDKKIYSEVCMKANQLY